MMLPSRSRLLPLAAFAALSASAFPTQAAPSDYYSIRIVDDVTGRGVPLVELRTTNNVRYYTDSNGIVAVGDPELMGQNVYFKITSPGYHVGKDNFGYTGTALDVKAGGHATVKIARDNIAERLYRITGAGIYRDSVLTGASVPIKHPLLNGKVMGQDTVEVTPYKGKLYWFFGDTDRPSYPLGQFATSGATSELPGLDPSQGVDLTYWVGKDGFSRPMIQLPNAKGPVWVAGLFAIPDAGAEHLYTFYAEVDHNMKPVHLGLARFNDDKAVFESVHEFAPDTGLRPEGHPFFATENGAKYIYFQPPRMGAYPLTRTTPDLKHITDSATYEAFTCLAPGARYDGENSRLDRDATGKLVWSWKRNTQPLGIDQVKDLVSKGKIKADEALVQLRDIASDDPVMSHGGSVFWNAHRQRWILITTQAFGNPSYLGEVWFAEADTPVGPWTYARKIATHDHYTYYNPTQHPFFDQQGGRLIYFEGTYVDTFSDVKDITPRYNYNQLMYRVDLDDPRLALPAPVYEVARTGNVAYEQREQIAPKDDWSKIQAIPFYAVPGGPTPRRYRAVSPPEGKGLGKEETSTGLTTKDRYEGLVAVYASDGRLQTTAPGTNTAPLFYALPATADAKEKPSPSVTPLYEYKDRNGRYRYSTSADLTGLTRSPQPLCRVWRNPSSVLALDGEAVASPSAGK